LLLLVSETTPFLALPKKQVPRAQVIFVVQAGRRSTSPLGVALATEGTQEISSFFFDIAKVQKIQSASKLFFKKSTQKSTHPENRLSNCYTLQCYS